MAVPLKILIASRSTGESRVLAASIQSEFDCRIEQVRTNRELHDRLETGRPEILFVDAVRSEDQFGLQVVAGLRGAYPDLLIIPLIPTDRRILLRDSLAHKLYLYLHTPIEPAEAIMTLSLAREHLNNQAIQGEEAREESSRSAHAGSTETRRQTPGIGNLSKTGEISRLTRIDWSDGQVDFRALINSFEIQLIVEAMEISEGNKMKAARLLKLKRTTLLEKIKKKNLNAFWED